MKEKEKGNKITEKKMRMNITKFKDSKTQWERNKEYKKENK